MQTDAHTVDDLANYDDYYAADISEETSEETSGDDSSESPSYETTSSDTAPAHDDEANLPPADRGTAAWLTLVSCFWLDGLIWGM